MRIETFDPPDVETEALHSRDTGRPPTRLSTALRLFEEMTTAVFFLTMFVTIIAGIAFRMVFDTPLVWTVGVSTLAFIGVVLIGSIPLNRDEGHIAFDLVYERTLPVAQVGARLFSDLLIIVPFAMAIGPTIRYLSFLHDERVPGIGLPFSVAFSPFLIFLVGSVLHRLVRMFREIRGLYSRRRSAR